MPSLPQVDKPSQEETDSMIANGTSALKTGFQYLGWGAGKLKDKAEEHKVAERMKAAAIDAKKKSDESGLTDELSKAAS